MYAGWFSIDFNNFESMLYDHRQVKPQIHIGPQTSQFWDTATWSMYVGRAEIPVWKFIGEYKNILFQF